MNWTETLHQAMAQRPKSSRKSLGCRETSRTQPASREKGDMELKGESWELARWSAKRSGGGNARYGEEGGRWASS